MDTFKTIITLTLILGPPMAFGILEKPMEMRIAVVVGAIAAAFFNIDKFKRFKGAGFEAELKEAVDKAYATLDSLKELAKPLILATTDILTSAGRWGGMDAHQKHVFMKDLEQTARSLSLRDKELEDAKEKFYRFHTWDHLNHFIRKASEAKNIDNATRQRLSARINYHSHDFPTKKELFDILGSRADDLSENVAEALNDYLYYVENKMLRRPETLPRE